MRRARFWLTWSRRDLRRRWLVVAAIAGVIAIGTGLATGLGSMETWRLRSNDASFAALDAHDLRVSLAEGSYARAGQLVAALRRIPSAAGIAAADERLMAPNAGRCPHSRARRLRARDPLRRLGRRRPSRRRRRRPRGESAPAA